MKTALIAATVAIGLATSAGAASVDDRFTSFYSFGDSLTDDGKFGMLEPPSFGGRFTNGPTWSEYIEDTFDAAGKDNANFALGGATAGPVNLRLAGQLSTFAGQIATFTASLGASVLDPGANPLVSVWFGANDIFQGFNPIDAANDVADGVRQIASIVGQSFDDFLVIKLPEIPGAPGVSDLFNGQLTANIAALKSEGYNIITYDPANATNAIIADFLNGSPLYGITDLVNPCTADLTDGITASCLDDGIDPNTRLFVDAVHPNAVAHQIVAEQVSATIIAAIPLPATLPLMFGVLGLGAAAARRRKTTLAKAA